MAVSLSRIAVPNQDLYDKDRDILKNLPQYSTPPTAKTTATIISSSVTKKILDALDVSLVEQAKSLSDMSKKWGKKL